MTDHTFNIRKSISKAIPHFSYSVNTKDAMVHTGKRNSYARYDYHIILKSGPVEFASDLEVHYTKGGERLKVIGGHDLGQPEHLTICDILAKEAATNKLTYTNGLVVRVDTKNYTCGNLSAAPKVVYDAGSFYIAGIYARKIGTYWYFHDVDGYSTSLYTLNGKSVSYNVSNRAIANDIAKTIGQCIYDKNSTYIANQYKDGVGSLIFYGYGVNYTLDNDGVYHTMNSTFESFTEMMNAFIVLINVGDRP